MRLFLRLWSKFQGSGRDMSKDLLLKDECFSDRTRSCVETIPFEARLSAHGQSWSGGNLHAYPY